MALVPKLNVKYQYYTVTFLARPTDTIEVLNGEGQVKYLRLTEAGAIPSSNPQGNIFFNDQPMQVAPELVINDGRRLFSGRGSSVGSSHQRLTVAFDLDNKVYSRESTDQIYSSFGRTLPIQVAYSEGKQRYYINGPQDD